MLDNYFEHMTACRMFQEKYLPGPEPPSPQDTEMYRFQLSIWYLIVESFMKNAESS